MSTFRLHVVRVEALLDLGLAASRGLHSGSPVDDAARRIAADTAGGLAAYAQSGGTGAAPTSAGDEGSAATFGSGRRADDFSVGAFGRAASALGGGDPAASRAADHAPAPVTPTAGTAWSFGAAVRDRGGLAGGTGSAGSDVSSISGGSWQRTVSPVRPQPPASSSGGRGRTTTGRGERDGEGGGALLPREPSAPTVREKLLQIKRQGVQAQVASARAQADMARTSAAVNSAAVVKLAKGTVSHECQLYESRRFVASLGGSTIGWDNVVASIGDEGSSDALNKLSVLDTNNDGAAARAELRLPTPEADSVTKTPGGLFLAYGVGSGWFKQVSDAVWNATRLVCGTASVSW